MLYDNGDRQVGTYSFVIEKEGALWRIASDMAVDTTFLMLPIRLRDENRFTHDGNAFLSFQVRYFKDVPLQRTVKLEVSGTRGAEQWTIRAAGGEGSQVHRFALDRFEEIRNLVSRLVRPEAALRPGEVRKTLSLDPIRLEIGEVETRGVAVESIEFQGRRRDLFGPPTMPPLPVEVMIARLPGPGIARKTITATTKAQ